MQLVCTYLFSYLLTHLLVLTYLPTPCSRVLPEKLTSFQRVKKFPAFYGTQKFIITLTSGRHLSIAWARSIQPTPPHPTSWRSIIILSFHVHLSLPCGLFPSDFLTKILYAPPLSSHTCYMPNPSHYSQFYHQIILGEKYRSLSSLYSFHYFPVTSSLLGPNILLRTLFSNTLSLCPCLNVSDRISHPQKNDRQNYSSVYL